MKHKKFILFLIISIILTSIPVSGEVEEGKPKVDIVFIVDASFSSMYHLRHIRGQLGNFSYFLQQQGVEYRLGLIKYTDRITTIEPMTSDIETFRENSVFLLEWGGSSGLDAIVDATKHFILVGLEEIYSTRGYTESQIKNILADNNVILTSVSGTYNTGQFKNLSDYTGGLNLDIDKYFGYHLMRIFELTYRKPTLKINTPNENQILSDLDSSFIPTVTASDPDGDTLEFEYYIDSETTPRDTRSVTNTETEQVVSFDSLDIGGLSEGQHSFRFTVSDGIETVEEVVSVVVDKLPPTLEEFNITTTDTNIFVVGSATDDGAGMSDLPYKFTIGSDVSNWTTNTSYSINRATPNTEYGVKFEARDKVGHSSTREDNVYTKAQRPNIVVSTTGETEIELSIEDSNPAITEYQINVGSSYVNQSGELSGTPQWITLNNKIVNITGLLPNTDYNIKGKARNQEGIETQYSSQVTATTLANPPSNITMTPYRNSIEITWDGISGVSSYDVEVDGQVVNVGTNTTYTHNNLSPDTRHNYRVRANNRGGHSDWSEILTETTLPIPPETPANINATVSQTYIAISWDETLRAEEYILEVDGETVNNGLNTSYTHDNLETETEHTYRVKAKNRGGESGWSQSITKETLPYPPETPTGVRIEKTKDTIILRWSEMERATKYILEVDGLIIDNGTATEYTHTGLEPLSGHTYRLSAENKGGRSSWTEQIDVTTHPEKPLSPENIMGTSEEDSITVTWYKVLNAESYDIEVDGTVIEDITDTKYIHEGLSPDSDYVYRVRAKNVSGMSEWSKPLTMFTLPKIETSDGKSVSLTNIIAIVTNNSITLSWDAVAKDVEYEIEVDGVLKDNGDQTIFNHTELGANEFHSYKIRFKDKDGTSQWCGVLALATLPNPPDAPGNIEVYPQNDSIELKWQRIDGATGYDVEVDGNTVYNGNETRYIHENLEPGTSHVYRVRAKNITGLTAWSDSVSESTINPTYMIASDKEEEFNLSLLAANVQDFTELKFVVTYNEDELEVVDLYTFTPKKDVSEGLIEGTNITVTHSTGRIEFTVDKNIVPGTSWSGEISDIMFKSKVDGEAEINFTVEK